MTTEFRHTVLVWGLAAITFVGVDLLAADRMLFDFAADSDISAVPTRSRC